MESKHIQINDCYMHYIDVLPASDSLGTLIFLHGFPEHWRTWRRQIEYFGQDYRVIVPDLPGYNLSSAPKDIEFYRLPNLINVIARFVESVSSGEPVTLVAHDWGGAIAWPLTAFYPELMDRLIILNAAHPSTYTREIINNPIQRSNSEYIYQLIAQDAEQRVIENDFHFLVSMFESDVGESALSDVLLDEYKNSWQLPNVVTGMLNYYRAMPQLAPSKTNGDAKGPVKPIDQMTIPNIRIDVPTLILWGEKDRAFVTNVLDGLDKYVADLRIHRFKDANHWLHHQQPEQVNRCIGQFIANR